MSGEYQVKFTTVNGVETIQSVQANNYDHAVFVATLLLISEVSEVCGDTDLAMAALVNQEFIGHLSVDCKRLVS